MCPFGCMEQVQLEDWVERLKGCLFGYFRYLELILGYVHFNRLVFVDEAKMEGGHST